MWYNEIKEIFHAMIIAMEMGKQCN